MLGRFLRAARGGFARALTGWWGAVSGGAFFTWWSAALSFLVAGVFSIPAIGEPSLEGYARGMAVAMIGWVPLALALVPVAVIERRWESRIGRAVLVLTATVAVATIRAFVNDQISIALLGMSTQGSFSSRTATNILTALAVLSLVAVITAQHRATVLSAQRLQTAVARMRVAVEDADRFEESAAQLTGEAVVQLRADRERLLSATPDFDAVREYADEVRAASHRFDALAESEPPIPNTDTIRVQGPRVPVLLGRLVPAPWLSVCLVYFVACLPFAVAAGGPRVAVLGLLGCVLVDTLVNAFHRWASRGRSIVVRGVLFLIAWAVGGLGMLGVTFALLPDVGSLGLVPILGVPVCAALISLCRDAFARARAEEAHAAAGLAEVARTLVAVRIRTRSPLRRAVDLLHGRVQGRCVIFAAVIDEHAPTAAEIAAFRESTDEAFDEILRPDLAALPGTAKDELDRLLAAWRNVVAVTPRISDAALELLVDPATGREVVAVVNEALVNAVKHSTARTARLDIDVPPAGGLRVRVASAGALTATAEAGLGSGAHARVFQHGDHVVLEAVLAS